MVDEFQDTDELQWSLIKALGRPQDIPSNRIFLVGDAKQSIYRFRGGDVTVFHQAIDELGVEPVVLRHNFRSRPTLIQWFNEFFSHSMSVHSDYSSGYEPLFPGRCESGGVVQLRLHPHTTAEAAAKYEADQTARLITETVLHPTGAFEDLNLSDVQRHPTPPIAILLRNRKRLPIFERALQRKGIPYVVAKGVGFWSRPEILDLCNTLHALATRDKLSLIGALRSPLFGISDSELTALHQGLYSVDGQCALESFGPQVLAANCPARILRAAHIYGHLTNQLSRVVPSKLFTEVLKVTHAAHAYALQAEGTQIQANIRQLHDLVRGFDTQGLGGLHALAIRFLQHIEQGDRESEANLLPTDARVVLMTVHAAKGLEFSVVFLPECSKRPMEHHSPVCWARLNRQWHLASKTLQQGGSARERVKPGFYRLLHRRGRQEEHAEAVRLLYVAVTRARDGLYLFAAKDPEKGAPKHTWTEQFASAYADFDSPSAVLECFHGEEDAPSGDFPPPHDFTHTPTQSHPETHLAPIAVAPEIQLTPSSLDLFSAEPEQWQRERVFGLVTPGVGEKRRAKRLAGARGSVIHSILEDELMADLPAIERRWEAAASSLGASPEQILEGQRTVKDHLHRVAADAQIHARLEAPGWPEVKFRLSHGPVTLSGTIDRLWFDVDANHWVVLDWKSETLRQPAEKAAAIHQSQLLAYAWSATQILRAHGQPDVGRGEIYFTATGELVTLGPWSDQDFSAFESLLMRAYGSVYPSGTESMGHSGVS